MKRRIIALSIGCAAIVLWASYLSSERSERDVGPLNSRESGNSVLPALVGPIYDVEQVANLIGLQTARLDPSCERNQVHCLDAFGEVAASLEAAKGSEEFTLEEREAALIDLYSSTSDTTIATFVAALTDADLWVKDAAETGLYRHPNRPRVREALTETLASDSRDARVAAAELLEEMGATDLPWDDIVRAPIVASPAAPHPLPSKN